MAKIVTYECNKCGAEIVVTGSLETDLRPIYCCGMEVAEISSKKAASKAKKTAPRKKTVAKKTTTKKSTAKKKTKKR